MSECHCPLTGGSSCTDTVPGCCCCCRSTSATAWCAEPGLLLAVDAVLSASDSRRALLAILLTPELLGDPLLFLELLLGLRGTVLPPAAGTTTGTAVVAIAAGFLLRCCFCCCALALSCCEHCQGC
jgi:hypothetical protein